MIKAYCVKLMPKSGTIYPIQPKHPYVSIRIDGQVWTTPDINDAHDEANVKSYFYDVVVEECQ